MLHVAAKECAESEEGGSLDYESRMLQQLCQAEDKMVQAYISLDRLNAEPPTYDDATEADMAGNQQQVVRTSRQLKICYTVRKYLGLFHFQGLHRGDLKSFSNAGVGVIK